MASAPGSAAAGNAGPPQRTLGLWASVQTNISKKETHLGPSILDGLRECKRHFHVSDDARAFAYGCAGAIVETCLAQRPLGLGGEPVTNTGEILALSMELVTYDLERQCKMGGNGPCVLVDSVLRHAFDQEKAFYDTEFPTTWNNCIESFWGVGGFRELSKYLAKYSGTAGSATLETLGLILAVMYDTTFSKNTHLSVEEREERQREYGSVYQASLSILRGHLGTVIHASSLKPLDSTIEEFLRANDDELLESFYTCWQEVCLALIKSPSPPVQVGGWEQLKKLADTVNELRDPETASTLARWAVEANVVEKLLGTGKKHCLPAVRASKIVIKLLAVQNCLEDSHMRLAWSAIVGSQDDRFLMIELCSLVVAFVPSCSVELSNVFLEAMKDTLEELANCDVDQRNCSRNRNVLQAVTEICSDVTSFSSSFEEGTLPQSLKENLLALTQANLKKISDYDDEQSGAVAQGFAATPMNDNVVRNACLVNADDTGCTYDSMSAILQQLFMCPSLRSAVISCSVPVGDEENNKEVALGGRKALEINGEGQRGIPSLANVMEDSDLDDDDDDFSRSLDRVDYMIVEGAGAAEINGVYKRVGRCDGVPKYSKTERYQGRVEEFCLYRCKLTDGTQRWYLSIVPKGTHPGSTKDIDFYVAAPDRREVFDLPPKDHWIAIPNRGTIPAPGVYRDMKKHRRLATEFQDIFLHLQSALVVPAVAEEDAVGNPSLRPALPCIRSFLDTYDCSSFVDACATLRLYGNGHRAADLLNEVYERLSRGLASFDEHSTLETLEDLVRPTMVNRQICKCCNFATETIVKLGRMFIGCTVRNKQSLADSLEDMIEERLVAAADRICKDCGYDRENNRWPSGIKTDTVVQSGIARLPSLLIFGIDRFEDVEEDLETIKVDSRYEFPEILDLSPYCLRQKEVQDQTTYRLVGAVVHEGTAVKGRYFSLIRERSESGRWLRFMGSQRVEVVSSSVIEPLCFGGNATTDGAPSTCACALFYEQIQT